MPNKRIAVFSFISLILIVLNILAFAQFEEVEIFSVGPDNVAVSYMTDSLYQTYIEYGTDVSNPNTYVVAASTVYHYAEITGLSPETEYYVRFRDDLGAYSDYFDFTTLKQPEGTYLFSIGVFTDHHHTYNTPNDTETGYMFGQKYFFLENLQNDFQRNSASFSVLKGDITNDGTQQEFDDYINWIGSNWTSPEIYPVIGNHDKRDTYWETALPDLTPGGERNYSFDHNGWHFIFLDSAVPGGGHIDSETMTFLENDLSVNSGTKSVIFMHHLVNPIPGVTDNPYVDASYLLIDNYNQFKNLIEQYPSVWMVLSGHAHFNSVTYDNEILYVVSGPVVHYPIMYNVLHFYDDAIIQESKKISETISWSELSKKRIHDYVEDNYGYLGEDLPDQAIELIYGKLTDRCFNYKYGEYQETTVRSSESVKVYPNPVRGNQDITFQIQFDNIYNLSNVRIEIFTIDGYKAREVIDPQFTVKSVFPFIIEYKLKPENSTGRSLSSGIYIYTLTLQKSNNTTLTKQGKIAIVK